jgi:hypothetical protein
MIVVRPSFLLMLVIGLSQELQRYDPLDVVLQPLVPGVVAVPAPHRVLDGLLFSYSPPEPRNNFRGVTGSAARPAAPNDSYR